MKSKYRSLVLGAIVLSICFIISWLFFPVSEMSEGQALYLYSTNAQVVSGLFGLIFIAYTFFNDKLKANEDDTLFESTKSVLKQLFYELIALSILVGLTIYMNVISMSFGTLNKSVILFTVVRNVALPLFLATIALIIAFGISLFNPRLIEKKVYEQMLESKKNIVNNAASVSKDDAKEKENNKDNYDSIGQFLELYNRFERKLKDTVYSVSHSTYLSQRSNYYRSNNPIILDMVFFLSKYDFTLENYTNEINNIRKFRNGIVHNLGLKEVNTVEIIDAIEILEVLYDKLVHECENHVKTSRLKKDASNHNVDEEVEHHEK